MALQLLIDVGYHTVRQSWILSTVLVKYIIGIHLVRLAYQNRLSVKELEKDLVKYSRPTVAFLVSAGFVAALLMMEIPVAFKLFGQLTALIYFGFLFWKF